MKNTFFSRGWKYAILIPIVALAMTITFSAPVRAVASAWIKSIAGFFVEERNESPIKDIPGGEVLLSTPAVSAVVEAVPSTVTHVQPTEYAVPTLSVPDVLKNPPFTFGLPSWIPEGFSLDQNVGISTSGAWVLMNWKNPNMSEIEFLVEKEYTGYTIPAGVDSSEEIALNGTPALLIRGFWDEQHQWNPDRQIAIDWEKDGRHYHLAYTERDEDHYAMQPITSNQDAIIQNLIRMAESIP